MDVSSELIDFIKKLENQSFVGWSEESINGYITALKTIEDFLLKIEPVNN